MGYSEALEAAGAKVINFEQFGDYQGTWYALVEYNGQKGIVEGSYGSCSGCDAFEAEFSYGTDAPTEYGGKYRSSSYEDISREEYDKQMAEYNQRLSAFGQDYLRDIQQEDILKTRLAEINKRIDEDGWSFYEEEKEGLQWCLSKLTPQTTTS